MLMAGWLEGLMVEELVESMAVVVPVGGASLSGSNSSRMMRVLCVSLIGWGGGGERGWCIAFVLLVAAHRAGRAPGGGERRLGGVVPGGRRWAKNRSRECLPPAMDRMCFSPCHSGAHWTLQSWSGTGCWGVAGRQSGHVQTGTAMTARGSGEFGRQCACSQ